MYRITFTAEKERGFKLLTVQSVFMRSFGHQEKLTGIKIKKHRLRENLTLRRTQMLNVEQRAY